MKSRHSFTVLNELIKNAQYFEQLGRLPEAEAQYKKLLKIYPKNPQVLTGLGNIALRQGHHQQGSILLAKSLKIAPKQPEALFNQAMVLAFLNKLMEAVELFDQLISLIPDHALAYENRGVALLKLARFDEAKTSFEQLANLNPNYAKAYYLLGNALVDLKCFEAALLNYDQAISLDSNFFEAHCNRGIALEALERLDEALHSYNYALALEPFNADLYNNRGLVLQSLKRYDLALADFERAITLNADFALAYWNKALLKLLIGEYAEGWQLYEWRWHSVNKQQARHFVQELWLGQQAIQDKTILIHWEQGYGDFIQFCRYALLLEERGAKVVIDTPTALRNLALSLKGQFIIVDADQGEPLPAFDMHCPLMSLALACKTTVDTIPANVPYLYADAERQQVWQQRLGPKSITRIGLAWSGAVHRRLRNRSIPLQLFESLLNLPFEFHSLQKEISANDAVMLQDFPQLHQHQEELFDFADTAALIAEMDLVISIDTAVAHLAGAMAKPVWILLPYAADYRWLADRTDSPWYPAASLFRQQELGNWSSVLLDIIRKLKQI